MKIGLIDVDGYGKKKKWGATVYPNLAMCKIAAYHKKHGNSVEWYDGLFGGEYDIVYMSKVFNFSPDFTLHINAKQVIKGGTGYSITDTLPQEIDDTQPDLSIYPNAPQDISIGFLTRGCPNKCKWCVVPRKEGAVHPYWDIDRIANGNKNVILMDNNILAAGDYAKEQLQRIIDHGYRVDFNQALDARLVTEDFAKLLGQIKWIGNRIRFGCDTPGQVKECERAMEMINANGFTGEYILYTMLNNNFKECYERIHHWWEVTQQRRKEHTGANVLPYAQPYRDPDNPHHKIPQWQKDMAQWVNKHMIFVKCDFKDFEPRKGFRCEEYFKYG